MKSLLTIVSLIAALAMTATAASNRIAETAPVLNAEVTSTDFPPEVYFVAAALREKVAGLNAHALVVVMVLGIAFFVLVGSMLEKVLKLTLRWFAHMLIVQVPATIFGKLGSGLINGDRR
jgi:hypothetical protein